jgi:hypothetical protein
MSDFATVLEVARVETPAPVNIDVPHLLVGGDDVSTGGPGVMLTCTMGNWEGEPSLYAFQWRSDGTNLDGGGASHIVGEADAGHTIDCLVTATNVGGTTTAPASNGVAIE